MVTNETRGLIGRTQAGCVWPGMALSDNMFRILLFRKQASWLFHLSNLLIFSNLDYRPSAESLPPLPANWQILAWAYLFFFFLNFAKSNRNSQNSVFPHPLPLQLQVQKHLVWPPIITDYSSPMFILRKSVTSKSASVYYILSSTCCHTPRQCHRF